MDLHRHLNMLRRYWPLATLGLVLGLTLAILTAASPSWDGGPKLTHRNVETWESESVIFLTSSGFPEGQAVLPQGRQGFGAIDPDTRLARFTHIYGQYLTSDAVRALIGRFPEGGAIKAVTLRATNNTGDPLPLIRVTTAASSAAGAESLNKRAFAALKRFVEAGQNQAGTPKDQRAQLELLKKPTAGYLAKPRPMTLPIAAFILTFFGCIALAYVLENLRLSRAHQLAAMLDAGLVRPRAATGGNGSLPAAPHALASPNGSSGHVSDVTEDLNRAD
jgi:hypothetical protein